MLAERRLELLESFEPIVSPGVPFRIGENQS
jgi:hypothetical protein